MMMNSSGLSFVEKEKRRERVECRILTGYGIILQDHNSM
jgi:hypothetical protein